MPKQPEESEKLYAEQAAQRAGIATSTWRAYTAAATSRGGRRIGPDPDGVDIERGHARRYWYPATVDRWLANRPGRGARTDRRRTEARSHVQPHDPET